MDEIQSDLVIQEKNTKNDLSIDLNLDNMLILYNHDLSKRPNKLKEIKNKTETLYQKIIDATPQAAEIIVNLSPLAPFSKFFKNGIQNAVEAYKKYKESQS